MRVTIEADGFRSEVLAAAEKALETQAIRMRDHIVEQHLSGQDLDVRSGSLRNSITWAKKTDTPQVIGYRVGTNLPYAAIQEFGGTIRAKGKKLAIPIGEAKTPAGVPRYKSPRDYPGKLVLIKRKGKPPLLAKEATTKGGKIKPLYVLVSSVQVSGKGFMRQSFRERSALIEREIGEEIAARLGASFGEAA